MLDTISIRIKNINTVGEYIEYEIMEILKFSINRIPYCSITYSEENTINVILSYPRNYCMTNAYLIATPEEYLTVNNNFINAIMSDLTYDSFGIPRPNHMQLLNYFESNIEINIVRVDVAFTWMMENINEFSSYKNLYKFLNGIYLEKNSNAVPKKIEILGTDSIESLIFANTSNMRNYTNKVTIYNQMKKMEDLYKINQPDLYNRILKDFPDIGNRMRIEGSKRVNRKGFTPNQFRYFNIFREYVPKIGNYMLENLFDERTFNIVFEKQKERLKYLLNTEREKISFTYEKFILQYIDEIWDYELIRQAVMETILNSNTGYHACSTIKEILLGCQNTSNIVYFDNSAYFKNIQGMIRGNLCL